MISSQDIIAKLESRLMEFDTNPKTQNVGTVIENRDGVITAEGLSKARFGETVTIGKDAQGVVFSLDEDTVSIIMLGNTSAIKEGDIIRTSEALLNLPVSEQLLGRVVDPLGAPLDGEARIIRGKQMPLERIAPGVTEREPVNTPLKTGIKAIDSMIPIGRGQRELIIGDRGLGKTAIAIDTIINQRGGQNVLCIYVAIGQKQSTIAQVIDRLRSEGAMDYTIVVVASASQPAALQYLAPYSGCAIAEYFLEKGKDVLVVYDDLTKHAWAYRQLSLVLRRPAGREAYPGDIFYLHSRLLERAVKLGKDQGGGSITALPIIETQAGDISAYIPTNVISITDGQIYLQADLFNAGIRPAINVGLSVSRVGGAAQTPLMKSIASKMRLELAQYRELASFTQFGGELDKATEALLQRGARTTEILKQPQYQPLDEPLQILSIWLVSSGELDDIPLEHTRRFESEFHQFFKTHQKKLLEQLKNGQRPSESFFVQMRKTVESFKKGFNV